LGTGVFLAVAREDSPNLGWICGIAPFSAGFLTSSEHNEKVIGMISDRTEHSEAAPGHFSNAKKFWKYYTCKGVKSSAIALSSFYEKDENKNKFFEENDGDEEGDKETFKFMPEFLIIPQELIAWFLETEPTAFELYRKLTSLYANDAVPEEVEFALNWCLCACAKNTECKQDATPILFSTKEEECARWFKTRIETLMGPRHAPTPPRTPAPATPGPAPTPAVTPSPKKKFIDPTLAFESTVTILSNTSDPKQVSPTWDELLKAGDLPEAVITVRSAVEDMRKQLHVVDGQAPDLDYEQIIADLKALRLAPGGTAFAYMKLGEGMSVVQCRQLTPTEISNRDARNAAAHTASEGRTLTYENALNLQRRDPTDPAASYLQLMKCITAYGVLVAVIFTVDCPHFEEVWALREIIADKDRYEDDYFTAHTCRLIIFAILKDAHQYFKNTYQASTLQQARIPFPRSDLRATGHHIAALTALPQPLDFPNKWLSKGGGGKGQPNTGGGGGFGQALQERERENGAFGTGGGTPANRALHPAFDKLLAPLTNATIGSVCHAAGRRLHSLPYLYKAGDSGANMCYQHLFGECTLKRCRRYHATKADLDTYPGYVTALCNELQPGVDKLMKSQGSRKRSWDQK